MLLMSTNNENTNRFPVLDVCFVAFVFFLLISNASASQIHRTQRKTDPRVAEPLASYATFLGRS